MKNFDFLYNTIICSYLLMKKLTVLLALRHFSWLVSLMPLQASTWLPRMADWLKNGCRGCFVGACARGHPSNPPSRSSATHKPPLYYLPLCAQGTPFTHPPTWFFQGHSFTKDNNWNCYFFKRKYAFQMKNIKYTH